MPPPRDRLLIDRPGRELERSLAPAGGELTLAYVDAGTGPPVVLVHGVLTTLEDMVIALSAPLASRYRVLAFDRPGFGRSATRRFVDAGVWRQAEAMGRALEGLAVDRPVIVGHSFGASVALAMAMQRPDQIRGVVAVAPLARPELRLEHVLFGPRASPVSGDWIGLGAGVWGDRSLFPLLWRAMYLPQRMPDRVKAQFPFALAGSSDSTIRVGEDAIASVPDLMRLVFAASGCTVPIRILGGTGDLVVHNGSHGRMLAALLPDAEFIELPGLGHMAHHFSTERIVAAVDELSASG